MFSPDLHLLRQQPLSRGLLEDATSEEEEVGGKEGVDWVWWRAEVNQAAMSSSHPATPEAAPAKLVRSHSTPPPASASASTATSTDSGSGSRLREEPAELGRPPAASAQGNNTHLGASQPNRQAWHRSGGMSGHGTHLRGDRMNWNDSRSGRVSSSPKHKRDLTS